MKNLGFLILTNEQPTTQFIKLLEQLKAFNNSTIAIHHDYTQGGEFPKEVADKYSIIFTETRYKTYWSHINNVYATIDGLKELYNNAMRVDWFITLTPSCYAIKSKDFIQDFYDKCQFDALIDMHRVSQTPDFKELDQYLIRDFRSQPFCTIPFFTKKGQFYKKTIRKPIYINQHPYLETHIPYHGSNWLSLNRKAVEIMLNSEIQNGPLVKFYSKHIVSTPNMHPCPQETVIQTFIGNCKEIKTEYNNYRYINWAGTSNWSPNFLTMKNYKDIITSEALFARKFEETISTELVERIDNEIWNSI